MHARKTSPIIVLFAALILLLSSCQLAALETSTEITQAPTQEPALPADTPVIPAAQTPEQPAGETSGDITLDYSAVAENVTIETVPAQSGSAYGPYWEAMPEYRRLTLEGYTVAGHLHKPQIFIYPVADLAPANEYAGSTAVELQALLQNQQVRDLVPFLPVFNAMQVMHAQVQFLDFVNGKVVRFLTQFDQAPLPINNGELFYSFQGLTSDGKYYIAAVLPVTHPELPEESEVSDLQAEVIEDFQSYITGTISMLNEQTADSFTPNLDELDALVRSIEVK